MKGIATTWPAPRRAENCTSIPFFVSALLCKIRVVLRMKESVIHP
jgi:hypothetical protein